MKIKDSWLCLSMFQSHSKNKHALNECKKSARTTYLIIIPGHWLRQHWSQSIKTSIKYDLGMTAPINLLWQCPFTSGEATPHIFALELHVLAWRMLWNLKVLNMFGVHAMKYWLCLVYLSTRWILHSMYQVLCCSLQGVCAWCTVLSVM